VSDPDWLVQAKAEGRVSLDRKANPAALPGIEPCEPGATFEAVLPFPPSINHLWRHRIVTPRNGKPFVGVYTDAEGKAFMEEVALRCGRPAPLLGPLSVSVTFYPPDLRGMDLDNRLKALFDALAKSGAYVNDSQIKEIHAAFGPLCRPDGKTVIRIVPLAA
jgi:crossover junction endodeoxyribonuclease RusA